MKVSKITLYLLAACVLLGCTAINELKLQSKTDVLINGETVIPFRYQKKLVVVDVHLNNAATLHSFLFDTGAFQSKVEYRLSETLKLKTISKRDNGTAQGIKRVIEITTVDSIRLSTAGFFNIAAGKLKYDSKSYSPCLAEDGIIGANLIKLAHWKIDYQNKELTASQKPILPSEGTKQLKIDFSRSFLSGIPEIALEINGQIINDVIFDVGFNGGLVVPYRFAEKFQFAKTQTVIDRSTAGIFGANLDTLLIKQLNVKLGDFQADIPVEFSSLNKALLGNDFLEHFTVYMDFEDDKIILEAITPIEIDKTKPFVPGILNDSLWVVNRTGPKIPISIGDTLVSINGQRPRELFKTHCDYFLTIGKLLESEELLIETKNGNRININPNHEVN